MMSRAMRIANMETLKEKRDYISDSLVTPLKEVWFTLIHELVNIKYTVRALRIIIT
jgi:hypothetical protein